MTVLNQVRRIAVIGAGPSGLSAVKYLLAEKRFDKIDVFEQRSSVGGTWNYCPEGLKQDAPIPVPQLNPNEPLEEPRWRSTSGKDGAQEAIFVSPMYKYLDTNIPKELMRYSDKPFPADAPVLPHHQTVKTYLEEYAEDMKDHAQFETQILDVRASSPSSKSWDLITRSLRTGARSTATYDAVVVASGHFDVAYIPDIMGISHWNKTYPGVISHSKVFDAPESFRDKKVVVVGSSASGIDIGSQISQYSRGQVLASQRTPSWLMPQADTDKVYYPEIVEFLSPTTHERGVRFADGRIEEGIDSIVFCTGYLYSFPFLSSLQPPLITDGRRVRNIYQHLFYTHNPTLVFPVLTQRIIPFPMSENQAAVFARVWSGRLSLPSRDEMRDWENSVAAERGDGTSFHLLPFPMDADYLEMLYDWAAQAKSRVGLVNDGKGKQGNHWGEKERWMRSLFPEIRKRFIERGSERPGIKSLVQLGYDFDKWKREQGGRSQL